MGLGPTQGDEKRIGSGSRPPWSRYPFLCHPVRSRGICSSFHQPPMLQLEYELSSRPKRTQISYLAALATTRMRLSVKKDV